jgi:hypothetical protein
MRVIVSVDNGATAVFGAYGNFVRSYKRSTGTIEAPKDFSDHKLFEEYLRQLQRQTKKAFANLRLNLNFMREFAICLFR